MAKRKKVVIEKAEINNHSDIDNALKTIAVAQAQVDQINAKYNAEEQEQRNRIAEKTAPLIAEIQKQALGLEDYADGHYDEFEKVRTKEFTHGKIGFRKHPPKIDKVAGVTLKFIADMIDGDKTWAKKYLKVSKSINKDALLAAYTSKAITTDDLSRFNLMIKQDESFAYELNNAIDK
jgi:phage host-nuclease inhibitor protein Gam